MNKNNNYYEIDEILGIDVAEIIEDDFEEEI